MSSIQLRVPLDIGHRLHEAVFAAGAHEVVAFCLVSHVAIDGMTVLVVRHVLGLDESAYLRNTPHGAAWRGMSMLPVIDLAMREGLGIVLVHAHDFPTSAQLSTDDVKSARRLVPMFQARVPHRPHGSIVLGRGTAAGFLALPQRRPAIAREVRVRWMGSAIVDWPAADDTTRDFEVFDRQALVVADQGLLRRSRVAVIGLCGGGGHATQQLAHAGIGTIVGVDADVCDRSNLHRQVGMRPSDARDGRPKVKVMARLVRAIGTGSKFIGVEGRVPEPAVLEALRNVDVMIGCVDNLHARADLQEISWRFSIPYIDIGVSIRALKGTAAEPRVSIGGNVLVLIPGGFCMWCTGFLSDEKLNAETNGRARAYFVNKSGQAQVVSFNGVVASQAVSEALQLLTGFRGRSLDPKALMLDAGLQRGVLKLDGLRGTVEDWGGKRRDNCGHCRTNLGAGTLLWAKPSPGIGPAVSC
jgi:molybdopterin/thiamine biosynthesis adenylyltransferase